MKQTIKLTEERLRNIIETSIRKSLNENRNLYDSLKKQAQTVITLLQRNGQPISWRNIMQNMDYAQNTNEDFMEMMRQAIEDAMAENQFPTESINEHFDMDDIAPKNKKHTFTSNEYLNNDEEEDEDPIIKRISESISKQLRTKK